MSLYDDIRSTPSNEILQKRINELEAAIRKHAAQREDDRCWLDDLELYRHVGIDTHPGLGLAEDKFLSNCKRYWNCQQAGEEYRTDG